MGNALRGERGAFPPHRLIRSVSLARRVGGVGGGFRASAAAVVVSGSGGGAARPGSDNPFFRQPPFAPHACSPNPPRTAPEPASKAAGTRGYGPPTCRIRGENGPVVHDYAARPGCVGAGRCRENCHEYCVVCGILSRMVNVIAKSTGQPRRVRPKVRTAELRTLCEPALLADVDRVADALGWPRSEVIREALALGLPALERTARRGAV